MHGNCLLPNDHPHVLSPSSRKQPDLEKGLELGRESKVEEDHHLEEGGVHGREGRDDSKVMDIDTENMNKPLLQISTNIQRPEIRTQTEAVPQASIVRAR